MAFTGDYPGELEEADEDSLPAPPPLITQPTAAPAGRGNKRKAPGSVISAAAPPSLSSRVALSTQTHR